MRHVYGTDGNVAATIDSAGKVTLGIEPGPAVGLVIADTDVFAGEAGAERLGRVDANGRIFDAHYQFVGSYDASGRVLDVTGRMIGTASQAIDAAALILLAGAFAPHLVSPPTPPSTPPTTVMDEVIAISEEDSGPKVRKNYKPLTDEDIFGKPHKKS